MKCGVCGVKDCKNDAQIMFEDDSKFCLHHIAGWYMENGEIVYIKIMRQQKMAKIEDKKMSCMMEKIKCSVHKNKQAFYWVNSWVKKNPANAMCCYCVDQMIARIPGVKQALNIREISPFDKNSLP